MTKSTSPPVRCVKAGGDSGASLYDRIGGDKVEYLVTAFYARVESDPVIRPLYGKTLTCAIHGLTAFLTTWLGGPVVYDLRGARLRRRHMPFAIDARARDAWLDNMKAAVLEVGIPPAEAGFLLHHLELGAGALVNTGATPEQVPSPGGAGQFDTRMAEEWNQLAEAENLFDAVSRGDLARLRSLLPRRLVPHAELMRHALAEWLDPTGRADRRFGRRPKQVKQLEVIECLLAHRVLDCAFAEGADLARFRHLQAMIEAYSGVSRLAGPDWPFHASLRAATRDRFIADAERDPSCVRLLGLRGQTLLHEAALAGEVELAAVLLRVGTDPDAREAEGHTPLYRALTGDVARVLLAAGAAVDSTSGPTRGTALHQASRRGFVSVAQALLDHGATVDARDAADQTPLRRAVNCRQLDIVRLLVSHGADPYAADRRRVTPLDVASTAEMKQVLADAGRLFHPSTFPSKLTMEEMMTATNRPDDDSASAKITRRIEELGDWRGATLARVRQLIHDADPDIQEEWKWVKPSNPGTPVWSHDGIVCTGETYKQVVKLTFARGASLEDPKKLFNSSLEGSTRRALDLREGDKINEAAFKKLIRAAVAANAAILKQRAAKKK